MIIIENICKIYKTRAPFTTLKGFILNFFKNKHHAKMISLGFNVISKLSITISEGEVFGIIGPNGAGKSTLAKIIAGTTYPDSGKIEVSGKIIPFLELGVAFNDELTGIDNLYLNGVLLGLDLRYLRKNKELIFDFAEVKPFMKVPLKYYSSGMRLRLAFSIAMHAKGDIYIFDEILAVGDAGFQEKCMSSFRQLIKSNKTILIVSHDLSFLLEHADRLLYLGKNGHFIVDSKNELKNIRTTDQLEAYLLDKNSIR